jgi:spore maturation protein CgeB
MESQVLDQVRRFKPDLVVVTADLFGAHTVNALRRATHRSRGHVVCWFIDAPANLRGGNLFLCEYSAFFIKEPQLVETMTLKLGLPTHYLPEACNPTWHKPASPTPQQFEQFRCDIVAQGTPHPYRMKFFEGLLDFDVKIWGSAPAPLFLPTAQEKAVRKMFQGHYVAAEEKAAAFNSAKILVNSMHFAEQSGVNNTLFEAAGCGAFQLCDERPTLSEFFQPEEEVVTFRSRSELIEKLRYYLGHDDERKKIAARASERAHREHTYEGRLRRMLSILGLA